MGKGWGWGEERADVEDCPGCPDPRGAWCDAYSCCPHTYPVYSGDGKCYKSMGKNALDSVFASRREEAVVIDCPGCPDPKGTCCDAYSCCPHTYPVCGGDGKCYKSWEMNAFESVFASRREQAVVKDCPGCPDPKGTCCDAYSCCRHT